MPATPPPAGLQPPEWVFDKLKDQTRESYISDHGFAATQLRLDWWQSELNQVKTWPTGRFKVSVDPNDRGATRLTRGDLFDLARDAKSDDDVLNLLWHVVIWGSGKFVRNNRRRINSFVHPEDEHRNVNLLRDAAAAAREGDARTAYSTLIRRGGGEVSGLGPAFYTKFLYFNSDQDSERICPILDARVAKALYDPTIGWDIHPSSRKKASRTAFSANWYTDTYVDYCDLLHSWAKTASADIGRLVVADEIEFGLFDGPPKR